MFEDKFFLAVNQSHPLAKQKTVDWKDIENDQLLLLEEGHCLRDQALEVCSLAGIRESVDFKATSLETLRYMVAAGMGMTLMPEIACKNNDDLSYLRFRSKQPFRTIGLVYRRSSSCKMLIAAAVKLLTRVC